MNIRDFQNEITVGSAAFFSGKEGFSPETADKLEIVGQTRNGWWRYCGHADGVSHYKWQRHTLQELVQKLSRCTDCKRVTTLLVPAFAQAVAPGMAPADYLEAIRPAVGRLSARHQWGRLVYEAYVSNGSLSLTDGQLEAAWQSYRAARHGQPGPGRKEAAQ